jgi:hypothetical protein
MVLSKIIFVGAGLAQKTVKSRTIYRLNPPPPNAKSTDFNISSVERRERGRVLNEIIGWDVMDCD